MLGVVLLLCQLDIWAFWCINSLTFQRRLLYIKSRKQNHGEFLIELFTSFTYFHALFNRLFVQYTISLSSLCKLIWMHWTYKMPVRHILSSVWVRLSILSPLSITQYVGLYVFSLAISLVMIERIYILCLIIIIKSEVWTITHCLGLGHETMVSAVCRSIFLPKGDIIVDMTRYIQTL